MAEQKLPKLTTRVRFPSPAPPPPVPSFSSRIVTWQRKHGRNDLPWQGTRDAYRIWVSEIMLQQTQVAAVIPYYERFMARFPDIAALAEANDDEVMRHWSGLGYYARARNLLAAARAVVQRHDGRFPQRFDDLVALPGIGRSTASAIAAFAAGERRAILDGNVKRVLARHHGIDGVVGTRAVEDRLWALAESLLPRRGIEAYTQGLMDLGATVCTRTQPQCPRCPVGESCVALREERIAELPGRRKAKAVPLRRTVMLVIVEKGEVLLDKRPAKGIWGGLWSLPEVPEGSDVASWCAAALGIAPSRVEALPPFTHGFTHFKLEVAPWRVEVKRRGAMAGEGARMWLALAETGDAALPAPVKKLLATLG
jgi:A/G-specific adenine glycosylase